MKTASEWFDEYSVSHQNATNKTIHYIFVPLIFFSVIGLFASIPIGGVSPNVPSFFFPYTHAGSILVAVGLIFYLRMSPSIFAGMLLISVLSLWGNHWLESHLNIPLWLCSGAIFVISWIFQFVGHQIEGAKPSFLKDLQFLLIGPAWILGKLYRNLGIPY